MKKSRYIYDNNRSMSQKTNNHGFWCDCDYYFILPGQRCPSCHKRSRRYKLKPTKGNEEDGQSA